MSDLFETLGIAPVDSDLKTDVKEVIPTNIIPLDIATGVGGIPRGRMTSIIGKYSTCKSTISILLARSNHMLGGKTIILDTENTYESTRLKSLGVDPKSVAILTSYKEDVGFTMETASEFILSAAKLAKPEDKLLIIWDTISSTPLAAEVAEEVDFDSLKKLMGTHSRMLSRLLRAVPKTFVDNNVTFVMVVQPKIDPMTGSTTYLGELPIKFHSSMIIQLSTFSKEEKRMTIQFEIVKNKVAPPSGRGKFIYYYKEGVDYVSAWEPAVGKSAAHYTLDNVSVKRTESALLLRKKKELIEQLVLSSLARPIPYRVLIPDMEQTRTTEEEENVQTV